MMGHVGTLQSAGYLVCSYFEEKQPLSLANPRVGNVATDFVTEALWDRNPLCSSC